MKLSLLAAFLVVLGLEAQNNQGYWQQAVDYTMEIDMDMSLYRYQGKQTAVYTNNSPDTLRRFFYHLHFNAFQPGSEMDVRSRTIQDPDSRIADRIAKLSPEEIGFIRPALLKQDGKALAYNVAGTVLEVELANPILPGKSSTFYMEWQAQVPVQIRRSGRNNKEGVALSMTQWYPKIAEYDFEGWHADPYIAREFHGVWGNFDVKITIDKEYTLGGTGYLQNPNKVGKGYAFGSTKRQRPGNKKTTWHFVAPNVHDFTWAADKDYIHDTFDGPNGVTLHFLYKDDEKLRENWKALQPKTAELMAYFNKHIGPYPYKQYSVIQGGDGGMEYGMCTLITGERSLNSLIGVTAHEMAHSWFQFVLATNESKHEWMDEGFTSYISTMAENEILNEKRDNPLKGSYAQYAYLANSGYEQPLSTHADRYALNGAYGIAAYSKGAVFLAQLGYIIGEENLKKTIKRYFKEWAFKHPTPNDFIRVAEKVSGFELDWYLNDFARTTNTIDYAVQEVSDKDNTTSIVLERKGLMPMPIDVMVEFSDGSSRMYHIPLRMARAEKPAPGDSASWNVLDDWAWAFPTYSFEVVDAKKVAKVVIDPMGLMADVKPENNTFPSDQ